MITAPISGIAPMRDTNAPNSSSDSASNAITNAAGGAMGKDQFVKLLVTEMQNQDPMNPMDGKDLAAQLAQFSSVEQLMNINTKLDNFAALFAPTTAASGSTASSSSTTGA
ncbi:MAG TPA: flagellar hook capping FlgD N-terminal domain-containing protein [Gemmatimonadaceae bacterium]|nr:flagellar hook capping FlgD N-terminal domain-containing protein [Gemmatimonadaceae bacterium]